MIEYRRHDVAYFAPCSWSKDESVQPQFHVHGADILQIHRSPFRNNVIRKIESVGLDGGIGFLLFCQLVVAVVPSCRTIQNSERRLSPIWNGGRASAKKTHNRTQCPRPICRYPGGGGSATRSLVPGSPHWLLHQKRPNRYSLFQARTNQSVSWFTSNRYSEKWIVNRCVSSSTCGPMTMYASTQQRFSNGSTMALCLVMARGPERRWIYFADGSMAE